MTDPISLQIYRRLDNRFVGDGSDDSPFALELHERRRDALEEVLDDPAFVVTDWGHTKDTESHELVALTIEFLTRPEVASFAGAAMAWIGQRVVGTIDSAVEDGIKALVQRLLREQKRERVLDYTIFGSDGTPLVTVRPVLDDAGGMAPISIEVSRGGETTTVNLAEIPD